MKFLSLSFYRTKKMYQKIIQILANNCAGVRDHLQLAAMLYMSLPYKWRMRFHEVIEELELEEGRA